MVCQSVNQFAHSFTNAVRVGFGNRFSGKEEEEEEEEEEEVQWKGGALDV